ncbi:formimidoylglutamate deiminase [Marinomonas epiphytica]
MHNLGAIDSQVFFAEHALLTKGWAEKVRISVRAGVIEEIATGCQPQGNDTILSGPALPTIANLHSHAFQRIMAGAAEVNLNPNDSFWSWRDLMYKVVQKLTPEDAQVIATQLYIDMLKAGYSQVGEFHYLHHAPAGKAYNNPSEMAQGLLHSANASGIGLTLLPVLYSHSGFGGQAPHKGQARFINSTDQYLNLHQSCETAILQNNQDLKHKLGICFHSLRAVTPQQIHQVLKALPETSPIHIHIAEQQKEVQDCLAWSGRRPIQWLADEVGLNERWCLVHATHMDEQERHQLAQSKAIAGLCPTTEANLGDGIFPAVSYEQAGGSWGIGSDSHVSLSVVEELRTLEYGQRLRDQQRNRLYNANQTNIGEHLFNQALVGGNQACQTNIGLYQGARADFMVLDSSHPFIATSTPKDRVNRWLFACNENLIKDVFVAGRALIKDFRHPLEEESKANFIRVIKKVMYEA